MSNRVASWLDGYAVRQWRQAHKLWSVRLALFWAVISGLYAALPAFIGMVSPFVFAAISMGFALAIVLARLTHQPGIVD